MAEETVNLDTQNQDNAPAAESQDDFESLDAEAQKERNRQLFARAKKAETEQKELKERLAALEKQAEEKKEAKESSKKDTKKPDTALLERLDKMALQVAGIKEADEVELFNKWKEATSREADDIVGNSIFQKELEELRTSKANQAATSDIQGERGESGARNTPEYWREKATKGADGNLLFPDEMPREMYSKVLNLLAKESGGTKEGELKFYNE